MASQLSEIYDMSANNHPKYSYPISNITYHLPDSSHPSRSEAVTKKAFQRIIDNYDENERLADAFQVELDKRQQIVDERKAEERRIRTERQRLLREEKRNKKLGKNHKSTTASSSTATTPPPPPPQRQQQQLTTVALAQAFQPRHGRYAATAGYSLLNERKRSFDTSGQRSRQSSEGSLHSTIISLLDGAQSAHEGHERIVVESGLSLASDHRSSSSPHPHSPPLLHAQSHPADGSLSSSPILPLTPSPHLKPSDTAFGVVAPLSTVATTFPTSSTTTFSSGQPDTTIASSAATTSCTNNISSLPTPPPQSAVSSSTLPMRNKRKQAIPVHPSVIKRIPGITFRIQPDLDQHLQVEILKTIEDYQSTSPKASQNVSASGHSNGGQRTDADKQLLQDASQLQANQDLNKVRQSITSSRPGYASLYIPDDSTTYDDPYLQDYRETSPHSVTLHAAPNASYNHYNNNNARYHPFQRHSRRRSLGTGHAISFHTPTNLRSRSNSSANIWAPYTPSPAGLAMLLSDVVAARATLPLSWDNFSTRDCQVNRVVGKNGRDFEQLEAAVQETVARHQALAAAAAMAQQEADEDNQEAEQIEATAVTQKHERKFSSAAAAATDSSESTADVPKKRRSSPTATPPLPSHALAQRATGSRATRSRTTHHTEGAGRPSRTGATDLVEGYDDIERILKEKRQKKREQQKYRDSQSRGVSEATTEGDFDMDVVIEQPRIKEDDVDTDDRTALLRRYTESVAYNETHSRRGTTKPPSPPHSRQVTPAAKVDLNGSSLHPHQQHAHLGSGSSRTPPATPTRVSSRHPHPTTTESTHQDAGAESTSTSGGRTRARARSFSSTIPTDAKTNFFESALEMIEAKRRQSIARKKASSSAAATTTSTQQDQDHHRQQQPDEHQQQQANPQAEQEFANETSQKMMAPSSNILRSSKLLPGRVLRKPRVKAYDGLDQDTASEKGSLNRNHDGGSAGSAGGSVVEVTYDDDCSSCRLEVTDADLALWKQARQTGEINLNPKTWGRTAILCSSCRMQYRRHGLRCTQCFYVPVWNPEPTSVPEGSSTAATTTTAAPAITGAIGILTVMPKAGGTCKRCKAGTWLQEA
ncbi:hypothetical protein BGX24_007984 [Mortierella sp. AD032]|nr:hypothetical protein BGX24_007984 [Mortierella sp. AD032]